MKNLTAQQAEQQVCYNKEYMNENLKLAERRRKHGLKRRRIIAGRLKAFGQKSIPIALRKAEKKENKPIIKEIRKVYWWRKVLEFIKRLWKK